MINDLKKVCTEKNLISRGYFSSVYRIKYLVNGKAIPVHVSVISAPPNKTQAEKLKELDPIRTDKDAKNASMYRYIFGVNDVNVSDELNHQKIPHCFSYLVKAAEEDHGTRYMYLVSHPYQTLSSYLAGKVLSTRDLFEILDIAKEAMQGMHRAGFAHGYICANSVLYLESSKEFCLGRFDYANNTKVPTPLPKPILVSDQISESVRNGRCAKKEEDYAAFIRMMGKLFSHSKKAFANGFIPKELEELLSYRFTSLSQQEMFDTLYTSAKNACYRAGLMDKSPSEYMQGVKQEDQTLDLVIDMNEIAPKESSAVINNKPLLEKDKMKPKASAEVPPEEPVEISFDAWTPAPRKRSSKKAKPSGNTSDLNIKTESFKEDKNPAALDGPTALENPTLSPPKKDKLLSSDNKPNGPVELDLEIHIPEPKLPKDKTKQSPEVSLSLKDKTSETKACDQTQAVPSPLPASKSSITSVTEEPGVQENDAPSLDLEIRLEEPNADLIEEPEMLQASLEEPIFENKEVLLIQPEESSCEQLPAAVEETSAPALAIEIELEEPDRNEDSLEPASQDIPSVQEEHKESKDPSPIGTDLEILLEEYAVSDASSEEDIFSILDEEETEESKTFPAPPITEKSSVSKPKEIPFDLEKDFFEFTIFKFAQAAGEGSFEEFQEVVKLDGAIYSDELEYAMARRLNRKPRKASFFSSFFGIALIFVLIAFLFLVFVYRGNLGISALNFRNNPILRYITTATGKTVTRFLRWWAKFDGMI